MIFMLPQSSLKSDIARGLKWQAIDIGSRQLLSFVVFTTLARLLEPSTFGLVGLIGVYIGFIGMFADLGIGAAVIQRQRLEPEHTNAAFWTNLGCAVVLCLGTIALASPIATLLGEASLAPLLRWSSLGLVIDAMSAIHSTLLHKAMNFRASTIRTILANSVGGAVGVSMAFGGYGVWALIAQQLSSSATGAAFLWSASPFRPTLRFSIKHFRELSTVGLSIFATSLLWFFTSRIDQLVIGRFIGIPTLGLYIIGSKIPEMAKLLTHTPLAGITLPALSKLQNEHKRMCETMYKGMELNATVSFAVFVGLAATVSDLVPFIFGAKWAAAAPLSALLSLYALVNVLQVFFHPALLASGGARWYIGLSICNSMGAVAACILGVQLGIAFLIAGMILTSLSTSIPAVLYLKRKIGLSTARYWEPCFTPAFAALFMVAIIWLSTRILSEYTPPPMLAIGFKVLVGAAGYIGFLWVFKRSALLSLAEIIGRAVKQDPNAVRCIQS